MENKKLINILIRDMQELEGLIADIKSSGEFNLLEHEFLQTKATGIRQLLELFKQQDLKEMDILSEKIPEETEFVEEQVSEEQNPEIHHEQEIKEEPIETSEEVSDSKVDEIPVNEEPEPEPLNETGKIDDTFQPENENLEPEPVDVPYEKEPETNDETEELELQENEDQQTEGKVLSDKFQSDKSVNDMISGGAEKLEQKLSMRPVSSIKSAIGINDRFLYTRELFNGDADLFNKAITTLDGFSDIKEAVAFLRENYKWKKNETSLKFVGLVKRRFMND